MLYCYKKNLLIGDCMKECAVLFSGGKDSFAVAICMLVKGYKVHLLSFDNGCMSGVEAFAHGALRLEKKYRERVVFNTINIARLVYSLRKGLYCKSLPELVKEYPHAVFHQLNCLICHSAMYKSAIDYCKDKGISIIADGGRMSQKFIVELPEMVEQYQKWGKSCGIEVLFPVLDIENDEEIEYIMSSHDFILKVYEAQCWVGSPVKEELTKPQIDDLVKYFIQKIKVKLV